MFNKQPTKSKLVPGVGRVPFPAYRGTEKFIFVSYAHKDEDNVFPEIIRFQNMKYNVWYDEILSPGNEWKKDVAEHLLDSDLFIIFMSNNSAVSRNCRKEFYCALEHNKHIIPFYLEDFNTIEIDSEWKADLSEIQGILMTNLNEEEYIYKFSEAFKKFDFNYGGVEISQNIIEELQKNLNEFDSVDWKFVTPYIGGTFIDMNAERNYFINEVFPEINEWCLNHRIGFSYADLRWGVTESSSKNRATLMKVLMTIDECRPFFIGFLGQKRGWIPDFEEEISDYTINIFKDIEKKYNGMSSTEMEIEYALLTPLYNFLKEEKCPPARYSLLFFRKPDYLNHLTKAQEFIYTNNGDPDPNYSDEKLKEFKERIIHESEIQENLNLDRISSEQIHIDVFDYKGHWDENLKIHEIENPRFTDNEWIGGFADFECNGRPLKETMINRLKENMSLAFPMNVNFEPKALNNNEIQLELPSYDEYAITNEFTTDFSIRDICIENDYCSLSQTNYIWRLEEDNLLEYIKNDDNRICLVSSNEGYGKTTLLSTIALYPYMSRKLGVKNIYKRFCKVSNLSKDMYSLWKSIILEAMISNSKTKFYSYPLNLFELYNDFKKIFNEIADYGKTVIIVDGIEKFDNSLEMLNAMTNLPENLKIIISIKNKPHDDEFTSELSKLKISDHIYSVELNGIDNDETKKEIILSHLRNFLKEIDDEDLEMITRLEASKNPLYLKIMLFYLIHFGNFARLREYIVSFAIPYSDSLLSDAFKILLERLEEEYGEVFRYMFFILEINSAISPKYIINKIMKISDLDYHEANKVKLILMQLNEFIRVNEYGCNILHESLQKTMKDMYGG